MRYAAPTSRPIKDQATGCGKQVTTRALPAWQRDAWQQARPERCTSAVMLPPLEEPAAPHGSPGETAQDSLEVVCERLQKHEEAAETGRVGNVVEGCEKQAQPLERGIDDD
eukprot:CAMPEP_0181200466 /NCGR_PEP_ID=MMETSP1096-20121128/17781_1 /TAXON_ID=156174 ORGANISM="Chrysochromulina ericina, Strain CCMP281" /NCGR_SAMPLE_ID=MMETSP1096 /ASSEMBLY_ACC=CAM_ASM_000453 /LENGTH=110 /DNA_ID=CAMNT_0023290829 /DNA_START=182 /DNA_END=515 /DNA_ORIENTATION=-